ncbi:proline-rich protein PRCC [Sphaerodactylus townsendi]|nr:proline-rich protein PRCC [Sphaerodactylus townsendi]XP_048365315.1 proline-rich protein PRCC [Sphaerodactylus townsendi]
MSLVAYASSGEEEEAAAEEEQEEEEEEAAAAAGGRGRGGLFSSLPPPKGRPGPAWLPAGPAPSPPPAPEPALPPPKAKKRAQPVRIAAPQLRSPDSDSEEDSEPAKKPFQGHSEGSGLSALLPQPKNLTVKETNRLLLPYAFSKKVSENSQQEPKPAKVPASTSKPPKAAAPSATATTTPSPSAIKAAAKNAALQVTKQITQEENDSDEEVAPENYFSLLEPPTITPEPFVYSADILTDDLPPGTEPSPEPEGQGAAANAPLEFKTSPGAASSQAAHGWAPKPGEDYGSQLYSQYPGITSGYYEDYYSTGYSLESADPALGPPPEMSSDVSSFMDDEAFKRLQGKRNRGREEINFVEIKGDDQLSGAQQWLTKSLTEEQNMKSFSKKKGEQPTGQQRRKHQITYLIHQAKERELELKNTWAENKLSRRQTQAKYGF